MSVPYWVPDSVFYQIFPDRFANGDTNNDPPNVQKWGTIPTLWGYQGGDLRGIIQKMDYLLELGVNALYLNPIFLASSTHRYNASDYMKIDPHLGDMQDFHALMDMAHNNNMRVVLDGVFNHCGRGFYAFTDVLENNEHSPYKDWFHVRRFPLDAYSPGEAQNFAGWWNHKSLPKFNTSNTEVRRYLMGVARYWIEQGADGWRLDVPNEIDDDAFWEEFRYVVKKVNRDAYILGEIWDGNPRWVNDKHCDGIMQYPVRDAIIACFNEHNTITHFAERVEGLLKTYPKEHVNAMYIPLGSHDTERIFSVFGGQMEKVKLAFFFQFSYPGAPSIYYGDEIGVEGGKDPDCRRAFPWDPAQWKADLQPWVRSLVDVRKQRISLRRGEMVRLMTHDDDRVYAFARVLGDEKTVTVLNVSGHKRDVQLPVPTLGLGEGRVLRSLLDNRPFVVTDGRLNITLEPWSGMWLG